ncbi:MAG TPA: hypothetical protein VFM78_09455, partial [Marinobacter sp.]|nr:hypothetical protein [Marinobacter sp.]
ENLPVKDVYLEGDFPDSIYVMIYISQYVTHSISEFGYLLNKDAYSLVGGFNYFMDEVCLVAMCDRSEYQSNIMETNERHGLYQTLYSSLLFDLGYIGIFSVFFIVCILVFLNSTISLYFLVYISMVVVLSLIDNYVYNAIGLGRFLLFVGLLYALSIRFRVNS